MEWILASASPRRKELFAKLIEKFDIIPATGEEKADTALSPARLVCALAKAKAEEIASLSVAKGKYILGADTIVAYGNEILGKPKDKADAFRMLKLLSGNTHHVYTGVCILGEKQGKRVELCAFEKSEVVFECLSDETIQTYIDGGSPMDKAGAYGIQDGFLVKEIQGSYSNIVGLPLELCEKLLQQLQSL